VDKPLWHTVDTDRLLSQLTSSQSGLTQTEADSRLSTYGPNRLSPPKKKTPFERFASQFNNVIIYVLIGSASITLLLGHLIDSLVIFGVVLINGIIGFIQEGKAEKALDAIRSMLSSHALVLRDGSKRQVNALDIVPGDIVLLQSGDKVPADMRLIKTKELKIDEAPLTGESLPVGKITKSLPEDSSIGDRKNMAFSGTFVTYGQGTGIVVCTGDDTELGRINALLSRVQPLTTRLLRQINDLGHRLTVAILVIASLTCIFGLLIRNYAFSEMFLAAVGLAVAAIPEGLPAVITITLAIGVQRMAKRHAIVRRLPAVETLGSVTVICSDKTGTLTKNEMTVQSISTARGAFEVTGVGYAPKGGFVLDGNEVITSQYPEIEELSRAAMLCNDSELREEKGLWTVRGDPTEGALTVMSMKAGLDYELQSKEYPQTDSIPFESEHRFMATLHHDHAGHAFIYVKGSPEKLLTVCTKERYAGDDRTINIAFWNERIEQMAGKGYRLLAIAFKVAEPDKRSLGFSDVDIGLTLLGIVGIIDPPRQEAIEAVGLCRSAGIKVKMITGDHAGTASIIGAQMGIGDGSLTVTGHELETLDNEALKTTVMSTDIFARVSPEHKLRIVQALQANNEVVAMTGDGVNDAPALKRADVGIAMGLKGTEVAKESAEMVLTDDNFATIAHAVEEGRTIYENIKKSIAFILPTNAGEAGIIIAAILTGRMLPITPVQILWINMITAVTLALSLAFEPPESGIMQRKPRNHNEAILSPFLIWRIILVSCILVIGTFGLFLWNRLHDMPIDVARTVAVNTLVMFEVFYLLNTRYLRTTVLTLTGLSGNNKVYIAIAIVVIAQLLFTYASPMQQLFGSQPISYMDWLRLLAVALTVFLLIEADKYLSIKYEKQVSRIDDIVNSRFFDSIR
jgi:magnesium-transporting ATPase (P-type)